mmetsp:Transcript_63903/g.101305  ORF Transcript_63903/g.101305 Transcript_63903/m.101305 type:complete len:214 (+) Transcript_63903:662-1303(+)
MESCMASGTSIHAITQTMSTMFTRTRTSALWVLLCGPETMALCLTMSWCVMILNMRRLLGTRPFSPSTWSERGSGLRRRAFERNRNKRRKTYAANEGQRQKERARKSASVNASATVKGCELEIGSAIVIVVAIRSVIEIATTMMMTKICTCRGINIVGTTTMMTTNISTIMMMTMTETMTKMMITRSIGRKTKIFTKITKICENACQISSQLL